jgi:hypothetical protein
MDDLDLKCRAFTSLLDVTFSVIEAIILYNLAAMIFHFHICPN